jgi:hypothetical protein
MAASSDGRVLNEFDWRGYRSTRGTWVILDLYGTNHDPRIWDHPELFRPERFHGWDGRLFTFIPRAGRAGPLVPRQGGGGGRSPLLGPGSTHPRNATCTRCRGERIISVKERDHGIQVHPAWHPRPAGRLTPG